MSKWSDLAILGVVVGGGLLLYSTLKDPLGNFFGGIKTWIDNTFGGLGRGPAQEGGPTEIYSETGELFGFGQTGEQAQAMATFHTWVEGTFADIEREVAQLISVPKPAIVTPSISSAYKTFQEYKPYAYESPAGTIYHSAFEPSVNPLTGHLNYGPISR